MPESSNNNTTSLNIGVRDFNSLTAKSLSTEVSRHNYRQNYSNAKLAEFRNLVYKYVSTWSSEEKWRILQEYGDGDFIKKRNPSDDELSRQLTETLIIHLSRSDLEQLISDITVSERKLSKDIKKIGGMRSKFSRTSFNSASFNNYYSELRKVKSPVKLFKKLEKIDKNIKVPKEIKTISEGLKTELTDVLNSCYNNLSLSNLANQMGINIVDMKPKDVIKNIVNKTLLYVALLTGKLKKNYMLGAFSNTEPYDELLSYTSKSYLTGKPGLDRNAWKAKQAAAKEALAATKILAQRDAGGRVRKKDLAKMFASGKAKSAKELEYNDDGVLKNLSLKELLDMATERNIKNPTKLSIGRLKFELYKKLAYENKMKTEGVHLEKRDRNSIKRNSAKIEKLSASADAKIKLIDDQIANIRNNPESFSQGDELIESLENDKAKILAKLDSKIEKNARKINSKYANTDMVLGTSKIDDGVVSSMKGGDLTVKTPSGEILNPNASIAQSDVVRSLYKDKKKSPIGELLAMYLPTNYSDTDEVEPGIPTRVLNLSDLERSLSPGGKIITELASKKYIHTGKFINAGDYITSELAGKIRRIHKEPATPVYVVNRELPYVKGIAEASNGISSTISAGFNSLFTGLGAGTIAGAGSGAFSGTIGFPGLVLKGGINEALDAAASAIDGVAEAARAKMATGGTVTTGTVKMATGGTSLITGDASGSNIFANGARPELVQSTGNVSVTPLNKAGTETKQKVSRMTLSERSSALATSLASHVIKVSYTLPNGASDVSNVGEAIKVYNVKPGITDSIDIGNGNSVSLMGLLVNIYSTLVEISGSEVAANQLLTSVAANTAARPVSGGGMISSGNPFSDDFGSNMNSILQGD